MTKIYLVWDYLALMGVYSTLEKARNAALGRLRGKRRYWAKMNKITGLRVPAPVDFEEEEKTADPITNKISIGWRIGFRWKEHSKDMRETKLIIEEKELDGRII